MPPPIRPRNCPPCRDSGRRGGTNSGVGSVPSGRAGGAHRPFHRRANVCPGVSRVRKAAIADSKPAGGGNRRSSCRPRQTPRRPAGRHRAQGRGPASCSSPRWAFPHRYRRAKNARTLDTTGRSSPLLPQNRPAHSASRPEHPGSDTREAYHRYLSLSGDCCGPMLMKKSRFFTRRKNSVRKRPLGWRNEGSVENRRPGSGGAFTGMSSRAPVPDVFCRPRMQGS